MFGKCKIAEKERFLTFFNAFYTFSQAREIKEKLRRRTIRGLRQPLTLKTDQYYNSLFYQSKIDKPVKPAHKMCQDNWGQIFRSPTSLLQGFPSQIN